MKGILMANWEVKKIQKYMTENKYNKWNYRRWWWREYISTVQVGKQKLMAGQMTGKDKCQACKMCSRWKTTNCNLHNKSMLPSTGKVMISIGKDRV